MAMKVPTRHTHLRRTGVRASSRPRKRRRIEQAKSVETEMTSELGKAALANSRLVAEHSQNANYEVVPNVTPRKDKNSSRDQFGSDHTAHASSSDDLERIGVEFTRNFVACSVEDFLSKYIPCECRSMPVGGRIAHVFDRVPKAAREEDMYDPFVEGLNRLVAAFPRETRISSYKTSNVKFAALHPAHHDTKPDLSSTPPGSGLPQSWTWHEAALAWEFKLHSADDPVSLLGECKDGEEHSKTRAQLYKVARNLLMAHLSCFVFVVGVYGPMMRFYRFDHSGIIGSEPSITPRLQDTFGAFCGTSPGTIVGADPTLVKPSDEDFEVYFTRLINKCPELARERENIRNEARLIDAGLDVEDCGELRALIDSVPSNLYSKQDGATICPIKCFAFEVLHGATTVVGRATHVYKILLLGTDSSEDRVCTLKDAWQQRTREHEGKMYKRVKENARHPKVQAELMASPILKLDMNAPGAIAKTGLANHVGTFNMAYCNEAESFGMVTQSARLCMCGHPDLDPRVHPSTFDRNRIRSIMTNIGRPLTTFRCTKELVMAIMDAVKGLEFLKICGLLHRDVSAGNILINDTKEITGGFLHDLDYSARIICAADNGNPALAELFQRDLKDMTGTRPFMAMGILKTPSEEHALHHDLESAFWVVVWCILRHTNHNHKDGELACTLIFDVGTEDHLLGQKQQLSMLFLDHSPLLQMGLASRKIGIEYVSIASVFEQLQKALIRRDWPENDGSRPFKRRKSAKDRRAAKRSKSSRIPTADNGGQRTSALLVEDGAEGSQSFPKSKRKNINSNSGSSKASKRRGDTNPGDTHGKLVDEENGERVGSSSIIHHRSRGSRSRGKG